MFFLCRSSCRIGREAGFGSPHQDILYKIGDNDLSSDETINDISNNNNNSNMCNNSNNTITNDNNIIENTLTVTLVVTTLATTYRYWIVRKKKEKNQHKTQFWQISLSHKARWGYLSISVSVCYTNYCN